MSFLRTGLAIYAAFACGAVAAGLFVSRSPSTLDDNVEPAVVSAPPSKAAAEQRKPAADRPQSRIIPIDQQSSAQASPTTGTGKPRSGQAAAGAANSCNQKACARAYRSFDSDSCTYQPSNGPRRHCGK